MIENKDNNDLAITFEMSISTECATAPVASSDCWKGVPWMWKSTQESTVGLQQSLNSQTELSHVRKLIIYKYK